MSFAKELQNLNLPTAKAMTPKEMKVHYFSIIWNFLYPNGFFSSSDTSKLQGFLKPLTEKNRTKYKKLWKDILNKSLKPGLQGSVDNSIKSYLRNVRYAEEKTQRQLDKALIDAHVTSSATAMEGGQDGIGDTQFLGKIFRENMIANETIKSVAFDDIFAKVQNNDIFLKNQYDRIAKLYQRINDDETSTTNTLNNQCNVTEFYCDNQMDSVQVPDSWDDEETESKQIPDSWEDEAEIPDSWDDEEE